MKKIYLAIPYSCNPEVSHRIANEVAAHLMQEGFLVFSPISHSHIIADFLPPPVKLDPDWWMQHDLPMLEAMEEVWVIDAEELGGTDGILQSKGVLMECLHAKKLKLPVKTYVYDQRRNQVV